MVKTYKTYTVKQAAEILGYCTNTIYTFLKGKRLKGIRVGKGKIHIPQAEINRILGSEHPEVLPSEKENEFTPPVINTKLAPLRVPSLFDWFVGIASVVLGGSLFLFSRILESVQMALYLEWVLPLLRASFILAGIGLLLSIFAGKKYKSWRKVIRLILFLAYLALSIIAGLIEDFSGMAIWGSVAFFLFVRFFVNFGGVKNFFLFIFLLALTTPIGMAFSKITILPSVLEFVSFRPIIFYPIILFIILVGAAGLRWGYYKNRTVFFLVFGLFIFLSAVLSFWYAQHALWNKSLFLLLVGVVSLFAPWWGSFRFSTHRDRLAVFTVFTFILIFFHTLLIIINVMQKNVLEYAQKNLQDRVAYGRLAVDQALGSAKTSLEGTASNPLLISEMGRQSSTSETLTYLARTLVDANDNLRRVLILDKKGASLATYPYDSIADEENFGPKDYFKQALNSQKVYVSTSEAISETPDLVLSLPIVDKQNQILGVLVGSLDLDSLNLRLQQAAARQVGEYFVVASDEYNYIAHPEIGLIGERGEENLLTRKYNYEGIRTIQAVEELQIEGWAIVAKVPLGNVLTPTRVSLYAIYITVALLIAVIYFSFLKKYPQILNQINGI